MMKCWLDGQLPVTFDCQSNQPSKLKDKFNAIRFCHSLPRLFFVIFFHLTFADLFWSYLHDDNCPRIYHHSNDRQSSRDDCESYNPILIHPCHRHSNHLQFDTMTIQRPKGNLWENDEDLSRTRRYWNGKERNTKGRK